MSRICNLFMSFATSNPATFAFENTARRWTERCPLAVIVTPRYLKLWAGGTTSFSIRTGSPRRGRRGPTAVKVTTSVFFIYIYIYIYIYLLIFQKWITVLIRWREQVTDVYPNLKTLVGSNPKLCSLINNYTVLFMEERLDLVRMKQMAAPRSEVTFGGIVIVAAVKRRLRAAGGARQRRPITSATPIINSSAGRP
jgi:hypothetical protein